jgi:hypothetical protein
MTLGADSTIDVDGTQLTISTARLVMDPVVTVLLKKVVVLNLIGCFNFQGDLPSSLPVP